MYWSPNFLAVVFKKQEITQQVVTRMQDLASEFSKKNFRGNTPRPLQRDGGDPLPHPTPGPALAGRKCPVLGRKLWPPQLFSGGCAPGLRRSDGWPHRELP